LEANKLDRKALAAKQSLQRTLDQFTNARPPDLDKQFVELMNKEKSK